MLKAILFAVGAVLLLLSFRATRPGAEERREWLLNFVTGLGVFAASSSSFLLLRAALAGRSTEPLFHVGVLAKWILAFVILDLANYGYHVLAHKSPFLWRFHAVHHSASYQNLSVGPRQSWIERLLITPLLFGVIAMTANVLFGISLEALLVVHNLTYFVGFLNHNDRIRRWPLVAGLVVSPIEHKIHHSRDPRHHDKNFGMAFIIWDRLFGTWRGPDQGRGDIRVGLSEEVLPDTVLGLQWSVLAGAPSRDPLYLGSLEREGS